MINFLNCAFFLSFLVFIFFDILDISKYLNKLSKITVFSYIFIKAAILVGFYHLFLGELRTWLVYLMILVSITSIIDIIKNIIKKESLKFIFILSILGGLYVIILFFGIN